MIEGISVRRYDDFTSSILRVRFFDVFFVVVRMFDGRRHFVVSSLCLCFL